MTPHRHASRRSGAAARSLQARICARIETARRPCGPRECRRAGDIARSRYPLERELDQLPDLGMIPRSGAHLMTREASQLGLDTPLLLRGSSRRRARAPGSMNFSSPSCRSEFAITFSAARFPSATRVAALPPARRKPERSDRIPEWTRFTPVDSMRPSATVELHPPSFSIAAAAQSRHDRERVRDTRARFHGLLSDRSSGRPAAPAPP